ncbi:MAG: hypothetical protein ACRDFQ_00875, partial [Anaerolineales bacterium]
MSSKEMLLEGLHEFDDPCSGFGPEWRVDGEVINAIGAEVFDGVAFFDEEVEAAAGVGAILGEDAVELLKGASAGIAQRDEGFFLARGQIGKGEDGFFLLEGAEVDPALPVRGFGECGMEGGRWVETFFQATLDSPGKQVPGT